MRRIKIKPTVYHMFARTLIATVCVLTASSGTAQGEDVALAFESDLHEGVREGYVTLKWNTVSGADRYRVVSSDAKTVYEGQVNQAFLSGLSDGTFEYRVQAISSAGSTIATSPPTTVVVAHWSLPQAVVLFGIGLIVMLAVVVVLIRGSRGVTGEVNE